MNAPTTQPQHPKTPPSPENPTRNAGATVPQACAACKHQRRRCKPDCPLAPYFPAEKRTEFLNAHKLFGVGNLIKIVRSVRPHERDDAMKSAIYEANARSVDPVGGCPGIIQELEKRIGILEEELQSILNNLAVYRTGGSNRLQTQLCLNHPGVYDPYFKAKEVARVRVGDDHQQSLNLAKHVSGKSPKFIQNNQGGTMDESELARDEMVEQYLNDRPPNLINGGQEDIKAELDLG